MESHNATRPGSPMVSNIQPKEELKDSKHPLDAIDAALAETAKKAQEPSESGSSDLSDTSSGEEGNDEDEDENENDIEEEQAIPEDTEAPHTKHEITEVQIPELPRDFKITDEMVIKPAGTVYNIANGTLVIRSNQSGEDQILDEGAVFCLSDRTIVGPLYETFGPIERPFFVVKFNTGSDLSIFYKEMDVFFVEGASKFVSTEEFKVKGSDASNLHDEEVAPEEQDFSDDEEEAASRAPKRRKRAKKANAKAPDISKNVSASRPLPAPAPEQQHMQSLDMQQSHMQMQMQRQMSEWQQQYQQFAMYQRNMGQLPHQLPFGFQMPQLPQPFASVGPQAHGGPLFPPVSAQAPTQPNATAPERNYTQDRDDNEKHLEHKWPTAPPNY